MGVVLVEYILKFLFVFFRNALVEDRELCTRLWVFTCIDVDIQSIFCELEMQVDFFIEQKRSYLEAKVPWLALVWIEVVGELSNYLIILFLGIVGYLVY